MKTRIHNAGRQVFQSQSTFPASHAYLWFVWRARCTQVRRHAERPNRNGVFAPSAPSAVPHKTSQPPLRGGFVASGE